MLIIEGTDGIGKTTLCRELLHRLYNHGPWVYRHFTKLPESWRYPYDYLAHISRFVVQDRFHLSEVTYREARGEPARLTPWDIRWINASLELVGAFTVIFTAPDARVEAVPETGQMHTRNIHCRVNALFHSIKTCDMRIRLTETNWPTDYAEKIIYEYRKKQLWFDEKIQAQARENVRFRP